MRLFSVFVCMALLTRLSSGAIVMIKQEESGSGALHFSGQGFGQSFKPGSTFQAFGIELLMKASPFGARTTTVEVFEYEETTTTFGRTRPISTAVIPSDQILNTQSWVMAQFSEPVLLDSKKSYAFVVSDGTYSSNQFYFSASDAYSGGAWLNIGSGGTLTAGTIDSAFRVYAVPEPHVSTVVAGFLLAVLSRRRRGIYLQN